ncbi:MAG: helix-turn-helix domain-containing protein [Bacillota bacterium]|nr:helix-turn-helix domain-containing protein [Bacillota bacterium]
MMRPRAALDELPDVLRPSDIIALTGLGKNSVYELLRAKRIPHIRAGRTILVSKATLTRFLDGESSEG